MKKNRLKLSFWLLLVIGFVVRIILVPYFTSGDLLSYAEWGEKFFLLGPKNFYFGETLWRYSPPNYMPLGTLMFGGLYWLFEHKFWLAQLHNFIKIPPSFFIRYFYNHGHILLLKLPSILADLGLGVIVYQLILKFTKNTKTALLGLGFFVLNPITIFLSGAWGQTDSLVSLFGMTAFLLLLSKKQFLSLPFLFLSLYLKPGWAILVPLYLFLLFHLRVERKQIIKGVLISFFLFFLVTLPFSGNKIISFTNKVFFVRLPISAKADAAASASAFNFYSIFLQIDRSLSSTKIVGFSARTIGLIAFIFINFASFSFIKKQKDKLLAIVAGIFIVGFGSYIFLTGMLERYFFASFAPLVILMFSRPKIVLYGILINLVVFANIIWSFFRRKYDEIDHPFTNNNFLLIRILSFANLYSGYYIFKKLNIFKR